MHCREGIELGERGSVPWNIIGGYQALFGAAPDRSFTSVRMRCDEKIRVAKIFISTRISADAKAT